MTSKLDDARIHIDPHVGALHEIAGRLELGPPKTSAAVRSILLPPFLVTRLRQHLDTHDRRRRAVATFQTSAAASGDPPPTATRRNR
jgi:hypothetical protein